MKFGTAPGVSDTDIDKVLTDYPVAALLGFAPRVRVAHLLGLIPKDLSIALREFAKIRNVYAHKDNVPPLTELTMQPILHARTGIWQDRMKSIVESFLAIQDLAGHTQHTRGRMALMLSTMMLGMELKVMRERVATPADPAPKEPATLPEQS